MNYRGIVRRSSLCLIYLFYRLRIHRIGAETVDRFRGESHKSAIRNYFRRYLYIFFFIRKFPGIH